MSGLAPKVGQRVEAIGKDCTGTIAYIGSTQFAQGKWIGKYSVLELEIWCGEFETISFDK